MKEFVNSFTNYLFVLTEYDMLKNAQNRGNNADGNLDLYGVE